MVADSILNGLRDQEDDVRTVAATSLLPVADKLYTILRDKVHVHVYCTCTHVFQCKYMYMYNYACMTLVFAIRIYTCTQCTVHVHVIMRHLVIKMHINYV